MNYSKELSPESETYAEGAMRTVVVNAYERQLNARKACLAKYGNKCSVCNISFEEVHGRIGKGFIHVHQKKPLAIIRSEYRVNPKSDLIPVCPKCHAMLHTSNPPLTVEELKELYENRKNRR